MRQEEGCLKLNLYSNLLGWHLLTDLQTLALLKSQVVAHKELIRIFTQEVTVSNKHQNIDKSWLYSGDLSAFQPFTWLWRHIWHWVAWQGRAGQKLRVRTQIMEEFEGDFYLAFAIRWLVWLHLWGLYRVGIYDACSHISTLLLRSREGFCQTEFLHTSHLANASMA